MNIKVGEKIKELRIARNITQAEFAKRIGVTTSTVSSYEVSARQPSYDVLVKIAKLFNVTTDYLLGFGGADVIDVAGLDAKQRNTVNEIILNYKENNKFKNAEATIKAAGYGEREINASLNAHEKNIKENDEKKAKDA